MRTTVLQRETYNVQSEHSQLESAQQEQHETYNVQSEHSQFEGGQHEQHKILLDVSLFAFDLLDFDRVKAHGSSPHFSLEVPGAFVTMIQYARVGSPLLRDFLYAYLQRMRQDAYPSESLADRILVLVKTLQDKDWLNKEATLAVDRIVKKYAPFIEGALEPPPGHPLETSANLEGYPADTSAVDYPIRRYEAVEPPNPVMLAELRLAYVKELGLQADPLFDLYFLQVYHGQSIGLAASPRTLRQLISLYISTPRILSKVIPPLRVPPGRPKPPPEEVAHQTHNANIILAEFVRTFVKEEWRSTVLGGAFDFVISFVLSGRPEIAPVLMAMAGGVAINLGLKAIRAGLPVSIQYRIIAISASTLIGLLLLALFIAALRHEHLVCPPPTPTSTPYTAPQPTPTYPVYIQAPEAGSCMYVVQPGDTLHNIAVRFQVNENNIRTAYNLPVTGALRVNQILIINANTPCCPFGCEDCGCNEIVPYGDCGDCSP